MDVNDPSKGRGESSIISHARVVAAALVVAVMLRSAHMVEQGHYETALKELGLVVAIVLIGVGVSLLIDWLLSLRED